MAVLSLYVSIACAAEPAPLLAPTGTALVVDFEDAALAAAPVGFEFGRTGQGPLGRWVIREDPEEPTNEVLVQEDADPTDYRFPVAVVADASLRDGRVQVRCRPMTGRVDQACGLVFRYRDADHYYITRANALEGNVRLYFVKGGSRQQIASWSGTVTAGAWHELRVDAKGDRIQVSWDGKLVLDHRDATFADAGKVGVWTKADSVTAFDDLQWTAAP